MREETRGVAISEFVGLKAKMCSLLVDDKWNTVETISYNE